MKNPKLRILNYVIPLITLLISIVCYFRLPDQITLSWDLNGAASSYEAKWHLFLMSGYGTCHRNPVRRTSPCGSEEEKLQ